MLSMLRQYRPIHDVPSACSRSAPPGNGCDRSNNPMLSSPRKPPPKTLLPSASLRLTHQVKFINSFWKIFSRNGKSVDPSIWNTRSAAQACTGGFTSSNDHS